MPAASQLGQHNPTPPHGVDLTPLKSRSILVKFTRGPENSVIVRWRTRSRTGRSVWAIIEKYENGERTCRGNDRGRLFALVKQPPIFFIKSMSAAVSPEAA